MYLGKIKKELQEHDQKTLIERAERWQELPSISTDGRLFASKREWDYTSEASTSYIIGNYRSTIFSCACALEQILRYEYLKIPSYKYDDINACTLGGIIKKCTGGKVPSLNDYLEKAGILNRIRNVVAAHPLFIDLPLTSDADLGISNILLIKDINRLTDLVGELDAGMKKTIEDFKLNNKVEARVYNLGRIISREEEAPYDLDVFWALIEQDVLKFLAKQSWTILKDISEGLYGVSH